MTFKEYCKFWKLKVPLTETSLKYYMSLGLECLGYSKSRLILVSVSGWCVDDDFVLFTRTQLRILLRMEDFNFKKFWDDNK